MLEFSKVETKSIAEKPMDRVIEWERESNDSVKVDVIDTLQTYNDAIKKSLHESRMDVQENMKHIMPNL